MPFVITALLVLGAPLAAFAVARAFVRQRREARGPASDVEPGRDPPAAFGERVTERGTELAEAERVLQRMWVLGQQITLELHPSRVLQRFVEAVMDVARADGASVGLVNEEGAIRIAASIGALAPLQGAAIPIEGSVVGGVVRGGRTWSSEDVVGEVTGEDRDSLRRLTESGQVVRSCVIVPIQRRGETIGAMTLVTRTPRRFTPVEIERVTSLTDMLSVALANAELVETLRQAEWRFRTLFRAAPDAVLTVLHSGRIREANDCVRDIVGLDPVQVVGRAFAELVRPEDRAPLEEALRGALAGRPTRVEVRCLRRAIGAADGLPEPAPEERVVSLAASRLPEADPPTVLVVGRDITGERDMRARLLETERLAAVGELVAGVAHEVNNPLSSISAFAQLLLRDGGLTAPQQEAVEVIRSETTRASQVVRDLLAFARRSEPRREAVDLNAVVERTLRLHTYQLTSSSVRVDLDLPPDLRSVMGDSRQLQQVVLNLVINAIQALASVPAPSRAREAVLRLATRALRDDAGRDVVELEIADTGPGIPPAARARIFEPFFTTKPEGEGTGLGLSVSYGIVTAHGGTIVLADTSPRGTRFVVTLPAAPALAGPGDAAESMPVAPRSPLAGIRLLFIDDEPALRSGMEAFGRLRGFTVVTADEGRAALEAVQHTAFDAVVCDLRMPGMSGPEFHRALVRERPGLARRTVFITGDVLSTANRPTPTTRQPTLAKPFTFERLEEAVVAVMRN